MSTRVRWLIVVAYFAAAFGAAALIDWMHS